MIPWLMLHMFSSVQPRMSKLLFHKFYVTLGQLCMN